MYSVDAFYIFLCTHFLTFEHRIYDLNGIFSVTVGLQPEF